MNRVLNIQGGGYTGVTAVIHWLSGLANMSLVPCELDIYRAPGGILNLYFAFRRACFYKEYRLYDGLDYLYEHKSKETLKPTLLRYFYKNDYIKAQISKYDALVTALIDTLISSSWVIYPKDVRLNFIDKFKKYSGRFKKVLLENSSLFFSSDFEVFFRETAYSYMNALFSLAIGNGDSSVLLILFNFLPNMNISQKKLFEYFMNRVPVCYLYCTRDPRDVFISFVNRNSFKDNDVDNFIAEYRWKCTDLHNTKVIRFEDFVLRHEETTYDICNFLQISKNDIDKSAYDIEYSKSRIGLWKTYPNQDIMNYIATELEEYLYE